MYTQKRHKSNEICVFGVSGRGQIAACRTPGLLEVETIRMKITAKEVGGFIKREFSSQLE
jgi:hypothetical protein